MQERSTFKILLFTLLTLVLFFQAKSQNLNRTLILADAAYAQNLHLQADSLYKIIDTAEPVQNPKLLIKMAQNSLQLDQKVAACFYLSRALVLSPSETLAKELERIAIDAKFTGYETGVRNSAILIYKRYIPFVISGLVVIAVFLLLALFTKKRNKEYIRPAHLALVFVFLLAGYGLNNLEDRYGEAIVAQHQVRLKDAPNALGKYTADIELGTKIPVVSTSDIWVVVLYQGQLSYIKKTDVLLIRK